MEQHKPAVVTYDTDLMNRDMAERGWLQTDLARVARVSDMTVSRFFRGKQQNARTAKKLAHALGHPLNRYLPPGPDVAVAS